jgi:hypothetical protein
VTDADPRDKAVCQSELSGSRIGSLVAETIVLVNPQSFWAGPCNRPKLLDPARWFSKDNCAPVALNGVHRNPLD